jgi:dCTP diphosphatase
MLLCVCMGTITGQSLTDTYPSPLSIRQGKAGKYTEYSSSTGITKEHGQSTLHIDPVDSLPKQLFPSTTDETTDNPEGGNSVEGKFAARLPALTAAVGRFAEEREWARFHTPRNLVLALIGELGELAELWQFRGDADDEDSWTPDQHDKLGQEIADVTIYLLRLATVCQMDLHTELPNLTADGV